MQFVLANTFSSLHSLLNNQYLKELMTFIKVNKEVSMISFDFINNLYSYIQSNLGCSRGSGSQRPQVFYFHPLFYTLYKRVVKDKIIRLSKNSIFVMMHFLNLDGNNSFNTNSISQIKLPRENILRSQVVSIGRRENPIWCCWRHPEDSYFESVRISSTQFVIARPGFLRSWQSHEVNLYQLLSYKLADRIIQAPTKEFKKFSHHKSVSLKFPH